MTGYSSVRSGDGHSHPQGPYGRLLSVPDTPLEMYAYAYRYAFRNRVLSPMCMRGMHTQVLAMHTGHRRGCCIPDRKCRSLFVASCPNFCFTVPSDSITATVSILVVGALLRF